jgi:hypothetical protein
MIDKFFLFLLVFAVFLDEFVSAADIFLEFLGDFFELDDFKLLDFEEVLELSVGFGFGGVFVVGCFLALVGRSVFFL